MLSTATNYYPTPNKTQGCPFPHPPLKGKLPQDCFLSFIDQLPDGYSGSILVRNSPQTNRDTYFVIKTRATSVLSYRRNYSHRSVALFRTKAGGATRANIAFMNCSFLELDGANDGTLKNKNDIDTLITKNNLPTASYTIGTSNGNFHLIWDYNNPLPWTTKNESYWTAQQKRLIQLFKRDGFNVDVGASLNPTQNLRNPSQLNAYNFKRGCQVHIHKTYQKTSLRAIYRALNKTCIANPSRLPASVKLRRYLRANQTFEITLSQLAENLKTSLRTVKTQVSRAVSNGDLRITARLGNNAKKTRRTQYESLLFIEQIPEVQLSSIKANALGKTSLLADFQANGAEKGWRNKTLFVLAVGLSCESDKTASIAEIADQLRGGAVQSGLSEKELVRTIKNAVKPVYSNPFSLSKLQDWDLIAEPKHFH